MERKIFSNQKGHVEIFLFHSHYNRDRIGYIHNVYTKPEFRGKGFGSQLVKAAVKWAGQEGCFKVFLVCRDGLEPFYRSAGLERVGIQMQKMIA